MTTTYAVWNEKRDKQLTKLVAENKTCQEVASAMGLTASQVERRAYGLGLRFSGAKVVPSSKPKREVPASIWATVLSRPPVRSSL